MEKVVIYCDGGCRGNGKENNVGGYGIKLEWKGFVKELYGGRMNTTNNIMELTACIEALKFIEMIRNTPIEIYTDSAYLCNAINQKWLMGWKRNGWKTSSKEPVKNRELWEVISNYIDTRQITLIKVKGHSDNEGNARADELANIGMDGVSEKCENIPTKEFDNRK